MAGRARAMAERSLCSEAARGLDQCLGHDEYIWLLKR
jgi:hypothetical protein